MRNKFTAYGVGILCHLLFIAAIASMAYMLGTGMTKGILPLGGFYGRLANIVLLIQFPLLHSFLLTPTGRGLLALPFPREIARDLVTTTYALVSSLQLLAVFVFWTPAADIWFAPSYSLMIPWMIVYALSWVLLLRSLSEAGLALHTGWLGWRAVTRGQEVSYPKLATKGLHAQCRHPIYLSFSLIILSAPVWSFDHFMLACLWVLYCIVGPIFKERRIIKRSGNQYELIKQTTPYIIPRAEGLYSIIRRRLK